MQAGCILYGSRYGSAARYAQALAGQTGLPAFPYAAAPALSQQRTVVYIGGVYIGSILGLGKALRGFAPAPGQRLILAAVGLGDPSLEETRRALRQGLEKQLSPACLAAAQLFLLRGALDPQRLSLPHRGLLALLSRALQKRPADTLPPLERTLAAAQGRPLDFFDPAALAPLAAAVRGGSTGFTPLPRQSG